jgi:DeoR/GlpR family transcriptional regulator of sugar metabolism
VPAFADGGAVCCALSAENGVTARDLQEAVVKRAAVTSSRRTILVAEGAKFTRTALASVYLADQIDALVTDETAPADALGRFREAGGDVQVT